MGCSRHIYSNDYSMAMALGIIGYVLIESTSIRIIVHERAYHFSVLLVFCIKDKIDVSEFCAGIAFFLV
jgi:hypothetical protein